MANRLMSDPAPKAGRAEFTGRYLVLGRQPNDPALARTLRDQAGLTIASSSDFVRGTAGMKGFGGADGLYLEKLGIAVATSAPDQANRLARATAAGSDLLAVERERIVFPFQMPRRDAPPMGLPARVSQLSIQSVENLVCSLMASGAIRVAADLDESSRTWGLVSTKVVDSRMTGRGVKVAVLDTGFDLQHPDFAGRRVVAESFVDGESAQDGHSHGTHCIGTALGPDRPGSLPRYGIASDAEIYVGKVIGNTGQGTDGSLLTAINWALTNGVRVISMSLGTAAQRGAQFSQVFEAVGQRALDANAIIIAAAGNESDRMNGIINPVGHPANCPSIMAVGAVDAGMQIASFSTRGFEDHGGGIDIVGPGVGVYSTVLVDQGGYGRKDGTSMACPHVAGIAALYVESSPQAPARDIWQALVNNARRLPLDRADVGAGFVQAPK